MTPGRVLLLVTSSSYKAEDFLSAARSLGVEVTVGSDHEAAFSAAAPGTTLAVDFDHREQAVATIADFHREYALAAIVAAEDEGTTLASAASAALGLLHNPVEAVRTARRKDFFREALRTAGILSPRSETFDLDEDPESVAARTAAQVGFPCVVKPVSLAASRGVIRTDDEAETADAFRRVVRIATQARGVGGAGPAGEAGGIIVEEYVPGTEVALEGLLVDGKLQTLAILDKPDPLEGPYFEETLFVTPSRLPSETQTAISGTARQVADAIGLTHGPVHAELRVNEAGVWPIEMAPRSIGGLCSRLFRFRAGVTLEELILSHATGTLVDGISAPSDAAGAMMIPIPRAGSLVSVEGTEAALAVPAIEDVVISLRPGQEVVPLPEGNRYLGFVFARSSDGPEAVERALREAHAHLEITIV